MMAANDKATEDALNSLASMFSNIDKEMIADIFLGCKRDFDATVDQLVNMGAEVQVVKQPTQPEKPKSEKEPHLEQKADTIPTPTISPPPISTPTPKEDYSEVKRLEELNQQLTREYRRLADIQESNMNFEKQLALKKENIALEQQKFEEERGAFAAEKLRLEDHLSARLREMKEQMHKNEEEIKQKESENRRLEDLARDEQLRLEAENRKQARAVKRETKQKAKETKRLVKAQQEEEEERIRKKQEEDRLRAEEREQQLTSANQILNTRVVDLEERILALREQYNISACDSEELAKQRVVETLKCLSVALRKTADAFTPSATSNWTDDLANTLRDQL